MKGIVLFILVMVLCLDINAQEVKATTEDGKRVILKPDWTWEYAIDNPTSDDLECDDVAKFYDDKIKGTKWVAAKDFIILNEGDERGGFKILVMSLKKGEVIVNFITMEKTCIDDVDKIYLLFRDGSRVELVNETKFNCEGKFTLYMGGPFKKMNILSNFLNSEIEAFRLVTSLEVVEQQVTIDKGKLVKKTIECVYNM